jgi:lysozyme
MTFTVIIPDNSKYQDNNATPHRKIDFKKMKAKGVGGAILRYTFGTDEDEDVGDYYRAAADEDYIIGGYGFIDYTRGVSKIRDQAKAFCDVLAKYPPHLPEAGDFEKPNQYWSPLPSRSICLEMLGIWFDETEAFTGRTGMLYTNADCINTRLVPVPAWLQAKHLWYASWIEPKNGMTPEQYIATYGTHPRYIGQWPTWKLWQYSSHGDGAAYGVESGNIDLNYYNGTLDELRAWAGVDTQPAPVTPPADALAILWAEYLQRKETA